MQIEKLTQDAQAALEDAPNGHLDLPWRYRIWRELEFSFPADFQVREALLALLVFKDLESLWVQLSLEDGDRQVFYQFLKLCRGAIRHEIDKHSAYISLNKLMSHGQQLRFTINRWKDFYIVQAGESACMCAIRGEIHPSGEGNRTDEELDADDFDTHFLASCAFANGPPWEPGSVTEARREYWEAWLSKHVPLVFMDDVEALSA